MKVTDKIKSLREFFVLSHLKSYKNCLVFISNKTAVSSISESDAIGNKLQ